MNKAIAISIVAAILAGCGEESIMERASSRAASAVDLYGKKIGDSPEMRREFVLKVNEKTQTCDVIGGLDCDGDGIADFMLGGADEPLPSVPIQGGTDGGQ
jgi:hypothetical protein